MSKSLCSHQLFQFYFKCSSVANAHMLLNVGLLPNCLDESVIQICIDIHSRNVNGRWGVKWLIGAFTFWIFCCHSDPMIYNQPAAGREISFLFGNYKEPQNNCELVGWTFMMETMAGKLFEHAHTHAHHQISTDLAILEFVFWLSDFSMSHTIRVYMNHPHPIKTKKS